MLTSMSVKGDTNNVIESTFNYQPLNAAEKVLSLISQTQALIKTARYSPHDNNEHENMMFVLKQLADPNNTRPVKELTVGSERQCIWNTYTQEWEVRNINIERGLPKKPGNRGYGYTKKEAVTLMQPDGKNQVFSNVSYTLGLVWDLNKVLFKHDQQGNKKYIWASNVVSNSRWWLTDNPSKKIPSISLEELQQNLRQAANKRISLPHNELLVCLSKEALSAIAILSDDATNRLNGLRLRYLVKMMLDIELPLFIITPQNGPQEYTLKNQYIDINQLKSLDNTFQQSFGIFFAHGNLDNESIRHLLLEDVLNTSLKQDVLIAKEDFSTYNSCSLHTTFLKVLIEEYSLYTPQRDEVLRQIIAHRNFDVFDPAITNTNEDAFSKHLSKFRPDLTIVTQKILAYIQEVMIRAEKLQLLPTLLLQWGIVNKDIGDFYDENKDLKKGEALSRTILKKLGKQIFNSQCINNYVLFPDNPEWSYRENGEGDTARLNPDEFWVARFNNPDLAFEQALDSSANINNDKCRLTLAITMGANLPKMLTQGGPRIMRAFVASGSDLDDHALDTFTTERLNEIAWNLLSASQRTNEQENLIKRIIQHRHFNPLFTVSSIFSEPIQVIQYVTQFILYTHINMPAMLPDFLKRYEVSAEQYSCVNSNPLSFISVLCHMFPNCIEEVNSVVLDPILKNQEGLTKEIILTLDDSSFQVLIKQLFHEKEDRIISIELLMILCETLNTRVKSGDSMMAINSTIFMYAVRMLKKNELTPIDFSKILLAIPELPSWKSHEVVLSLLSQPTIPTDALKSIISHPSFKIDGISPSILKHDTNRGTHFCRSMGVEYITFEAICTYVQKIVECLEPPATDILERWEIPALFYTKDQPFKQGDALRQAIIKTKTLRENVLEVTQSLCDAVQTNNQHDALTAAQWGADPNAVINNNFPHMRLLQHAISKEWFAVAEALLPRATPETLQQCIFEMTNNAGVTLLNQIPARSPAEFLRFIIALLADTTINFEQHIKPLLEITNNAGVTLLNQIAARSPAEFLRFISMLLANRDLDFEQRIKPLFEIKNNMGNTPLHWFAQKHAKEFSKFISTLSADRTINFRQCIKPLLETKNNSGSTVLSEASFFLAEQSLDDVEAFFDVCSISGIQLNNILSICEKGREKKWYDFFTTPDSLEIRLLQRLLEKYPDQIVWKEIKPIVINAYYKQKNATETRYVFQLIIEIFKAKCSLPQNFREETVQDFVPKIASKDG